MDRWTDGRTEQVVVTCMRLNIKLLLAHIFSRVLRDSTPCFVGRSVGPSIRWSVGLSARLLVVTLYCFWVFAVYGLTAPA